MAKPKLVTVHMDRSDEYDIDESRTRKLPVGWRGQVPLKVAREFEKRESGRIIPVEASAENVKTAKTADVVKKAATGNPTADKASASDAGEAANAASPTTGAATDAANAADAGQGPGAPAEQAGAETPATDASA